MFNLIEYRTCSMTCVCVCVRACVYKLKFMFMYIKSKFSSLAENKYKNKEHRVAQYLTETWAPKDWLFKFDLVLWWACRTKSWPFRMPTRWCWLPRQWMHLKRTFILFYVQVNPHPWILLRSGLDEYLAECNQGRVSIHLNKLWINFMSCLGH